MAPQDSQMRSAVPWMVLVPILIVAAMLATYVAGYVCLGQRLFFVANYADDDEPWTLRSYRAEWQAKVFLPMGTLESLVYGTPVSLQWPEGQLTCRSGWKSDDGMRP